MDMGSEESGSPLIQMMVHADEMKKLEGLPYLKLDISIIKYFVENGTKLNRVKKCRSYDNVTSLDMAISLRSMDIIKVFIRAGADPVLCGDGSPVPF